MFPSLSLSAFLLGSLGVKAGALPQLQARANTSSTTTTATTSTTTAASTESTSSADPLLVNQTGLAFTLPQYSTDPVLRAELIEFVREGFLYGPALAGGPYYPDGVLGLLKDAYDYVQIQTNVAPELVDDAADLAIAEVDFLNYDGLTTLDDYAKLYDDEWKLVLPHGPLAGILTNYTQDLLFSMERLSTQPYSVRRLDPSTDTPAFAVSDAIAQNVTGYTLDGLLAAGRLFYVDYSNQANLTASTDKYAGAVDAYFYIDETSGDFLPLAIHTNVGAGLVYTPADTADDWLFAKMMYSANDFWFGQFHHLAGTHEVVQIAWMAAIRTLSVEHPVFNLLNRLTYQVFAVQVLAATILFDTDGQLESVFAYDGASGQEWTTADYFDYGAGNFEANYFLTDLQSRGLINSTIGPALKSFPFYEDASRIHAAQTTFMTAFVESYYSSDSVVLADTELQAWVTEAQGPAAAIGFPDIETVDDLIAVLVHFAHLVSTAHHAVNTNELMTVSASLPFHPAALYSPLPTEKGVTDIVQYLPGVEYSLLQLNLGGLFMMPLLVDTDRSLIHQFDDAVMLALMNEETTEANTAFVAAMTQLSTEIGARTFDAKGLSQGMPFIWQALDPLIAPYSVTI